MEEIKVGQEFWFVPSEKMGNPYAVKVFSIGRKWFVVKAGWMERRIDKETFRADGGKYSSPGTCWPSKAQYETYTETRNEWDDFRRRLTHLPPPEISVEKIKEIRELFGIPPRQVTP